MRNCYNLYKGYGRNLTVYVLNASDSVFRHICLRSNADASVLKLVEDTIFTLGNPHAQQLRR